MNWKRLGDFQKGFFSMGIIVSMMVMYQVEFERGLFMFALSLGGLCIPYIFYPKEKKKEVQE